MEPGMSTTTVVATGGFVLVTVGLVGMNVSELAQRRTNNEEFREALQNQETEQMMRLGIATEQDTAEQLAAKAAVKAQRIRDKEAAAAAAETKFAERKRAWEAKKLLMEQKRKDGKPVVFEIVGDPDNVKQQTPPATLSPSPTAATAST